MAKITSRFPDAYRLGLFFLVAVSWCSGVTFFILDHWVRVEGEFGPERHPWQVSVLQLHGAGAFAMMIAFGYLLASHVPAGWKTGRMRFLGTTMVAVVAFLVVSAYLLYYLADDQLRVGLSWAHASAGFSLPFLLATHFVQAWLARRKRRRAGRGDAETSRARQPAPGRPAPGRPLTDLPVAGAAASEGTATGSAG